LPALQDFAQAILAGRIESGKLGVHLKALTQLGDHFNVHVEPAEASIDNFELQSPHAQEPPIKWDRLSVTLDQMDLAHHQATVKEIRSQGLALFVRRERDGKLSLTSLLTPSASSIPEAQPSSSPHNRPAQSIEAGGFNKLKSKSVGSDHPGPSGPSNSWQYKIESVVLERAAIRGEDDAAAHQVSVAVAPLNIHLQNVSSDPARQSSIETDGIINGTGNFKINGTVTPKPLKADLRVMTRAIDCAIADPYVSNQFNATIKRALLFINGRLGVVQEPRNLRLSYRGDAGLGKVMLLDRLTRGPLLRWRRFSADRINFESGAGQPKIHIGSLALSDFDASILLNQDGHLNLRDITGSSQSPTASQQQAEQQQQSSKSVTKAKPTPPGSTTGASTPAAGASASSAPRGIPANIEIGRITLQGGNINYADNFIRPNYSANLTGISGKIGSFGTKSTAPAEVALAGQINGNSPINIDGSINPLLPMAFLDIKAKANGIELPEFTPYSTKYTGYPIVKGALTVDVHYLLDQQKLTAENHIFIDQLTFGDKVENSSATNLPIRLAVSLLKDARGQIDLRVPVSGSLNDPHFSIGAVILHAFVNLIMKAATAPFSLLASAIGKSGGTTGDDYSRIIFDPGWATLSPQNQTKIDALAKMLKDRPALKLNITGRVDPRFDVNGLREATVTRAVGEQKSKAMGGDESGESPAINVSADEYDKYLARAYKAADFAKPRNAIGLTKSLPPDEMKKLMLEHVSVTNDDLRKLAVARADAVEKALAAKIEPSRLAVIAPKLNADDIKDKSKTTRLDLSFQ
ncbi:MAG TPA: DUF748 domain-containing protein, partial [Candidatus Binataceae bacterium]|nr:DUF748 domain-containing protein [Candidatus Binataceae bacterium]